MSKEIAKKWFQQASHDLEMAERNIEIEGYDVASFLAHQALEKLLKCILILEGTNFPKTHKLDRLAESLELPVGIIDKIFDLTEDYTFSRYPDASIEIPYLQYDSEISERKVGIAKEVFELLKERYKILED